MTIERVIERVIARDDRGVYVETDVIVRRRVHLAISCACWNHRRPFRLESIETPAGLYYRIADTGELFRELGHVGPITVEVERIVVESR